MQLPVQKKEVDLLGEGSPEVNLGRVAMLRIISDALASVPEGSRIVAIVPDTTPHDTTHILFRWTSMSLPKKGIASFEVRTGRDLYPV